MSKTLLRLAGILAWTALPACAPYSTGGSVVQPRAWLLVDDFEGGPALANWTNIDAQNDTVPSVPNPQISVVATDSATGNHHMLRKPAAEGIVGNRKAIGFRALPVAVPVGATYTLYTRVNVESFPNNHSFGLSNTAPDEIAVSGYDAFEPMVRITDKSESNGYKNDGTLMVLSGYKTYAKIMNPDTGRAAEPMLPGEWYEIWCVVNNAAPAAGGQRYDLYIRGGEFANRKLVATDAVFRVQRTLPLQYFMAISNTGSPDAPYGNGGVRYDDIYLAAGRELSSPRR